MPKHLNAMPGPPVRMYRTPRPSSFIKTKSRYACSPNFGRLKPSSHIAAKMSSPIPSAVQHISTHVLTQLDIHRTKSQSPLFVALQGPQGSGKSYTTFHLAKNLSSPPHNLRVATVSLDDLYLPHSALAQLISHTNNPLLHGRGLPGTHDIPLAIEVLTQLKHINHDGEDHVVHLPVYDKSLFNGQGDRSTQTVPVHAPPHLDVVIVEGWCTGFYPISQEVLDKRWEAWTKKAAICKKEDIIEINEMLEKGYVGIWDLFDSFVQVRKLLLPSTLILVLILASTDKTTHTTPWICCIGIRYHIYVEAPARTCYEGPKWWKRDE